MYVLVNKTEQNEGMKVNLAGSSCTWKKELVFPGSLDKEHGSKEPDDHGCWKED